MVDRRQYRRFDVVEPAISFVTNCSPHCFMAGKVTDVSDGGISLCYMGSKIEPSSSVVLDIVFPGSLGKKMSLEGNVVWDVGLQRSDFKNNLARQCGIRFKDLSENQSAYLEYMIKACSPHSLG